MNTTRILLIMLVGVAGLTAYLHWPWTVEGSVDTVLTVLAFFACYMWGRFDAERAHERRGSQ